MCVRETAEEQRWKDKWKGRKGGYGRVERGGRKKKGRSEKGVIVGGMIRGRERLGKG